MELDGATPSAPTPPSLETSLPEESPLFRIAQRFAMIQDLAEREWQRMGAPDAAMFE